MPSTDFELVASVGFDPSFVRFLIGICIAIVWTFSVASGSTLAAVSRRDQVQVLERTEVAEVEDRAEVDEEAVVPLAGEHRLPGRQRVDGRLRERRVVRSRPRPDVARRRRQTVCRSRFGLRPDLGRDHLRHVVELALVPVRVVERVDRPGVVEERVRVAQLGVEPELVGDVGPRVAVVVDVDRVDDVVAELEEVRPAGRILERDVVRDDRDRVGLSGLTNAYVSVLSATGSWLISGASR